MVLPTTASDEELLALREPPQAAGEAFGEFYRRYERAVLAFHVRRVRQAELAADLSASTFVEALAARTRFRGSRPGDSAAWLFGIASHVLARHFRRSAVELRHLERMVRELEPLSDQQLGEIESLTESGPLTEALQTLPRDQREAIEAYVLGESTYEEIAARSQIHPAAARKRVSRGLAALRAAHKEAE